MMRLASALCLAALAASQPTAPTTPAAAEAAVPATTPVVAAEEEAPKPLLAPGECESYVNGTANVVLCFQKATPASDNTLLLVGFLYNNGTTEVCDLKLAPLNAPGMTAFWPDWAQSASYEKYFNLKQITAVGMTASPNTDASLPSFQVTSLRACAVGEPTAIDAAATKVANRKIPIADADMLPPVNNPQAGVAVFYYNKQAVAAAIDERRPNIFFNGPLSAQECYRYTNGSATLALCVEAIKKESRSVEMLSGFLYNDGEEAACDVRIRAVNSPGLIDLWPDWAGFGASYEMYFNPKQVSSVGLTTKPNADGSSPSIEVYSFHACGKADEENHLTQQKVPIGDIDVDFPDVEDNTGDEDGAGDAVQEADVRADGAVAPAVPAINIVPQSDKAYKAFKAGYDVTADPAFQEGVDVEPDDDSYDACKKFASYDPNLELTLCLQSAKTWHDKKKGRVVSTDLALINTGTQGVCNITVYIEGMENELDHFPQLIDDNGFDTFPKFTNWYAPGRLTNLGSAIPRPKGIPKFYILKDFAACDEPDPNIVKRKFKCTESTKKPNGAVKICVYSDLKEWTDEDAARMVSVEGFLSNTGQAPLCNLTVDITNFENARAKWGDWMPTFPYYLDPESTLKFAANIPYEKGFPKVSLKKYQLCPHEVEEPAEPAVEIPKEESAAAVAAGAPATPPADAAPAPPAPDAGAPPAPAAPEGAAPPAAEAPPAPPAPPAAAEGAPAAPALRRLRKD